MVVLQSLVVSEEATGTLTPTGRGPMGAGLAQTAGPTATALHVFRSTVTRWIMTSQSTPPLKVHLAKKVLPFVMRAVPLRYLTTQTVGYLSAQSSTAKPPPKLAS